LESLAARLAAAPERSSMVCLRRAVLAAATSSLLVLEARAQGGNQPPPLLSDLVDVSRDFHDYTNAYYVADSLTAFDPRAAAGEVTWRRYQLYPRLAFDNMEPGLVPFEGLVFPGREYATNPSLPLRLQFVSPRTVRVRLRTGPEVRPPAESLMLVKEPGPDPSWKYESVEGGHRYASAGGSLTVLDKPWHLEFRDPRGRLLTRTQHPSDYTNTLVPALPFLFVRRSSDYSRSLGAVFYLSPGEKLFGTGESFTRLDKRGQRVVLWANDANGVETERMYKPVPFFMSSRGYGMFLHTSAPATFDMGATYQGSNALLLGDDELDLFFFFGSPKEILDEYTTLTGKAPLPPLWSFGLWMSRISYFSEEETRAVAARLRENRIPSDVIHLDTGWFETDWRCDYEFSKTRFQDPARMIADLKKDGFRISLWQLPYFVPKNRLFPEILQKGLAVRDAKGNLPYEDAVLDFSNPDTVAWYREKIARLLRLGVGAIKVDFGEAAPLTGLYASGRSGFYEHNLYPLRYNRTVADVTREVSGESIIWARSAWAGSQRYPVHWGGDAAKMDAGMAATLRGGLSFGLSGFTFWSHDIGGFTGGPAEEVYRRWVPFGMLTSHSRSHGMPPKEPWELSAQFLDEYRRAAEMKYRLMPYVYAQAKDASARGLPMVRALFVEYPDDPGAWSVEDEYLFGTDMLVAPLFEAGTTGRDVYLPGGRWVDYQSGRVYARGWQRIEAGAVPAVILVREGAVLPHIALAPSTSGMDWSRLELVSYGEAGGQAEALLCLPRDNVLRRLPLVAREGGLALAGDPLAGQVRFRVRRAKSVR
jgi:alpha-D-xyloside xylohydrolase